MRNHLGKIVLFLLLASLAELGCAQSGADSTDQVKPSNAKGTKSGSATPPGDKTAGRSQSQPLPRTTSDQDKESDSDKEPSKPGGDDSANNSGNQNPNNTDQAQAPWWLNEPIVVLLIGLLIFLGLALHIVHILTQSRFKKAFAELHSAVQSMSQRVSMADLIEKNGRAGSSNELTERLNRHRQGLDQLSAQIYEVEQRVTANERHTAEGSTAVALAAHLAGQPRINQALNQAAGQTGEADRAAAIKVIERYKEILGANEVRLRPLMVETCDFAQWLNGRSNLPPELIARMEELRSDVRRFEHWHSNVSERLTSLKHGSVSDRFSTFRTSQADLVKQFNARAISIADYVKTYAELLERHFPPDADGSVTLAPGKHETELRAIAAGVPDYLMDWFDRLSQLQAQAEQAAIEAETAARLARVQRTARDVLARFDIQPDEIQVGITTFDRRLHDASLITQSPQYPANTVVGVQQYGFRKMSTGDVLRRPKVVVAGVGAR
jgi:GrpE protein